MKYFNSMIFIESVTIRNFLSVGAVAQTVALSMVPLTLILGENLDVGGENSRNGSGKTTVPQAISYAIFDEPLTRIKKDNLVNSVNEKNMEVSIAFQRDGVPYRIERGRKPNYLRFLVGAERQDVAQGANRNTQVEIERVIGMSHVLFLHIVALNTFTQPFLKMRPADQREIVEELMGITQISRLAEQLKAVIDGNKEALRNEEAMVQAVGDVNARIAQAIERARREAVGWTETQERLLDDLRRRIAALHTTDIDAALAVFDRIDDWNRRAHAWQQQIDVENAGLATSTGSLARLRADLLRYAGDTAGETGEIDRLHAQADRLRAEAGRSIAPQLGRLAAGAVQARAVAAKQRIEYDRLRRALDAVTAQVRTPDAQQCTTCGQPLSGTDHLATVLAALERQQRELTVQMTQTMLDAERCDADAAAHDADAVGLQTAHTAQACALHEQAAGVERDIVMIGDLLLKQQTEAGSRDEQLRRDIAGLQSEIDRRVERLAALAEAVTSGGAIPVSPFADREAIWRLRQERETLAVRLDGELARVNPFVTKIDALAATLATIDYTRMNELLGQLKHEQFLYKLLTSKDSFIRKRIIEKNLPYLNKSLNCYLQRLGLPHTVCFLADLSVEITLFGRDFDFEQLSRGEMNRIILATSFAFRDLWQNLNQPLNLVFADEVLDQGVDQAGVEAAVLLLQEMAARGGKNIFLISHRDELRNQMDHVLVATKEDQFTTYAMA